MRKPPLVATVTYMKSAHLPASKGIVLIMALFWVLIAAAFGTYFNQYLHRQIRTAQLRDHTRTLEAFVSGAEAWATALIHTGYPPQGAQLYHPPSAANTPTVSAVLQATDGKWDLNAHWRLHFYQPGLKKWVVEIENALLEKAGIHAPEFAEWKTTLPAQHTPWATWSDFLHDARKKWPDEPWDNLSPWADCFPYPQHEGILNPNLSEPFLLALYLNVSVQTAETWQNLRQNTWWDWDTWQDKWKKAGVNPEHLRMLEQGGIHWETRPSHHTVRISASQSPKMPAILCYSRWYSKNGYLRHVSRTWGEHAL